jgi:hypothetical protein
LGPLFRSWERFIEKRENEDKTDKLNMKPIDVLWRRGFRETFSHPRPTPENN